MSFIKEPDIFEIYFESFIQQDKCRKVTDSEALNHKPILALEEISNTATILMECL